MSMNGAGETAIRFLLAMRQEDADEIGRLTRTLATLDEDELVDALADDRERLAFWVDLYNAAVLRQPGYDFSTWRARARFFGRSALTVAGRSLSLDDIEHAILRRSRLKLGLGYAANPLASRYQRRYRVDVVDPRIHFALNCAAVSCPPIAAYRAADIDEQLDLAARSYLAGSVTDEATGITVPAVCLWFIGDFGGPPGLRRFLRRHGVEGWGRPIRFAAWDWTPAPGRWALTEPVERT
jgi:hypothetical protein